VFIFTDNQKKGNEKALLHKGAFIMPKPKQTVFIHLLGLKLDNAKSMLFSSFSDNV